MSIRNKNCNNMQSISGTLPLPEVFGATDTQCPKFSRCILWTVFNISYTGCPKINSLLIYGICSKDRISAYSPDSGLRYLVCGKVALCFNITDGMV